MFDNNAKKSYGLVALSLSGHYIDNLCKKWLITPGIFSNAEEADIQLCPQV